MEGKEVFLKRKGIAQIDKENPLAFFFKKAKIWKESWK
jgi:hypothetical protein